MMHLILALLALSTAQASSITLAHDSHSTQDFQASQPHNTVGRHLEIRYVNGLGHNLWAIRTAHSCSEDKIQDTFLKGASATSEIVPLSDSCGIGFRFAEMELRDELLGIPIGIILVIYDRGQAAIHIKPMKGYAISGRVSETAGSVRFLVTIDHL